MGLRFRRYVKLAPGLRLNFSGSGLSLTAGPRGASVNFGSRGTYFNAGLPGTGLYARTRLDGIAPASQARLAPPVQPPVNVTVNVKMRDDGDIFFEDQNGNPVSEAVDQATKRQHGEDLRRLMQVRVDDINAHIDALGKIHLHTPDPSLRPTYAVQAFNLAPPVEPTPKEPGFFARPFASKRLRIGEDNAEAARLYRVSLAAWKQRKDEFETAQASHKAMVESGIYHDVSAMEASLEHNLHDIVWPRETHASFELRDDGKRIVIDVDLPEIGDLPKQTASMPARGYQIGLNELSDTQLQRLYMRHVHGIGFRIIGEAFASLPLLEETILSGYSQRPDPGTGRLRNDYLYSVRVRRVDWARIDFANLGALDVVEALGRFELKREMTKTGLFKPIDPISA